MITDQQLVINNLEEKLKVFTHAVNGKLTNEEDFILANTEIPTDTFNLLVSKDPNIKNTSKVRQGLDYFVQKEYPFCIWMDDNHMGEDWTSLIQAYGLEAMVGVMVVFE